MHKGDKVIVRSNNDEPYFIGTYLGHFPVSDKPNAYKAPWVEIDGLAYVCMGLVLPYADELRAELDKLTPKEQWNKYLINYKRQ